MQYSFHFTYEELKFLTTWLGRQQISSFHFTYEELKSTMLSALTNSGKFPLYLWGIEIYMLQLCNFLFGFCFHFTYEELK